MSKVNTLSDQKKERFGVSGKCDFCGETSKHYWTQNGETIEYCKNCGLKLFPKMLAEMVDLKKQEPETLLTKAEKNYWKSVAEKFKSSNTQ